MKNLTFSCLLTHQHPQSTIPVAFEMSGHTKFRMLRDYFHLAILRKTWSCQEAQETILSLSERIISLKIKNFEAKIQENQSL